MLLRRRILKAAGCLRRSRAPSEKCEACLAALPRIRVDIGDCLSFISLGIRGIMKAASAFSITRIGHWIGLLESVSATDGHGETIRAFGKRQFATRA